jgi:hypothetical protein
MHSRFDMHTQAVPLWEKKAGDEIIMIANFVTGAKRQHNTLGQTTMNIHVHAKSAHAFLHRRPAPHQRRFKSTCVRVTLC